MVWRVRFSGAAVCREKEQWEARAKQHAAEQQAAAFDASPLPCSVSHPVSHAASIAGNDALSVSSSCTLQSNRAVLCPADSSVPADACEHSGGQPAHALPSISAVKGEVEGEEVTSENAGASAPMAAAPVTGPVATGAAAGASTRARHENCEESIPLALSTVGLPTLKAQVHFKSSCMRYAILCSVWQS
jgi:hypothetical protein